MPKFAANLTMMFTELPFLGRFAAAADGGLRRRRIPVPVRVRQTASSPSCCAANGLTLVLHNLPAGDWAGGRARHRMPSRSRSRSFARGVDRAIDYAMALQCPKVNCLAGILPDAVAADAARATLVENLRLRRGQTPGRRNPAADRAGQHPRHSRVLRESHAPGAGDHRSDRLRQPQAPVRHLSRANHGGRSRAARSRPSSTGIGHIQLADNPGRHEPGTGEINYPFLFRRIDELGYAGWIGCEYKPATTTTAGLGWFTPYQPKRQVWQSAETHSS